LKITSIKQQIKRAGRYSVFVDGEYSFSLSEAALLDSKLVSGQELSRQRANELRQLSANDNLYNQTLRYIALKPRTKWEIETYLKRKGASPTLLESILNKLSISGLIDDQKYARAFVNDRRLLRPASRRKLINDLRKRHIDPETIEAAVGTESEDELAALKHIIERKRQQTKYQDDLKLMQYLARQGFNYGDIKDALKDE
jgi:regulatory protein